MYVCGGYLNDKCMHRHTYLNTWFPGVGTIWGGLETLRIWGPDGASTSLGSGFGSS